MDFKLMVPFSFFRKSRIYRTLKKIFTFANQLKDPNFVYKKYYTLGIYTGTGPINLGPSDKIKNPVLTAAEVTDVTAVYVADPFLMRQGTTWYMFFEVLNKKSAKGEIAVAQSEDGFAWRYKQIVLSEPFHLSYPYVFEWHNEYYMIPESEQAAGIRLYQAEDFPGKWSYIKTLIDGDYVDASIFYYKQRWWLFAAKGHDRLYLFFADNLMGPWQEHPESPLINGDPHIARPGGRVVVLDGKVIRYAQDDFPTYGLKVHAFEITELSTEVYQEKLMADSLLAPQVIGWNAGGMHHICPWQVSENQWLAAVDGWGQIVKAFPKEASAK